VHVIQGGQVRDDLVVLLDAERRPSGTAPKATVHTDHTPLHLAFSAYLFGHDGRFLMTRRAITKLTFPGVWSNSVCGHPAPGEDPADAAGRRVHTELGVAVEDLTCVLPDFAYRATDPNGIVENEVCPVFAGVIGTELSPDPDEVEEFRWVAWADVVTAAAAAPLLISPWSALQVAALQAADFTPPPTSRHLGPPEAQPTGW
jgi:isopentenyl-diphosphate delta-isomerase